MSAIVEADNKATAGQEEKYEEGRKEEERKDMDIRERDAAGGQ